MRRPVRAFRSLPPLTTLDSVFEVSRTVRFAEPPGGVAAAAVYVTVGGDKYAPDTAPVEIDCAARLPLCHAACCRLRVPLTRQDLDEGVVRWDADQPYLNRQRPDGYCVHCDAATHRCDVYAQRPGLCRTFDCRNDRRIWIDFERRNPTRPWPRAPTERLRHLCHRNRRSSTDAVTQTGIRGVGHRSEQTS